MTRRKDNRQLIEVRREKAILLMLARYGDEGARLRDLEREAEVSPLCKELAINKGVIYRHLREGAKRGWIIKKRISRKNVKWILTREMRENLEKRWDDFLQIYQGGRREFHEGSEKRLKGAIQEYVSLWREGAYLRDDWNNPEKVLKKYELFSLLRWLKALEEWIKVEIFGKKVSENYLNRIYKIIHDSGMTWPLYQLIEMPREEREKIGKRLLMSIKEREALLLEELTLPYWRPTYKKMILYLHEPWKDQQKKKEKV